MEMKQHPQLNQVMNLRFSMPVFHPNWSFPGSLDLLGWVSNDLWVLQISMICLLLSKVAMLCRDFFQNGIKTKYQSHHQRNHLLHLLLRYLLTDYRYHLNSIIELKPFCTSKISQERINQLQEWFFSKFF